MVSLEVGGTSMFRALVAGVALVAVSGAAEAARLTTPIQYAPSYGGANCRLAYFGQKKSLPVRVTLVGHADQPGVSTQKIKSFKMGPNNRGVSVVKTCDEVGGDTSCDYVRCVFDVPNNVNVFDFTGAVCHPGDIDGTGKYCSAAVAR